MNKGQSTQNKDEMVAYSVFKPKDQPSKSTVNDNGSLQSVPTQRSTFCKHC